MLREAGVEPFEGYDPIDKLTLDFYEQNRQKIAA
jgi:hypothetical protein